jgi:nicotinate-nucleotide adenylyltransferase
MIRLPSSPRPRLAARPPLAIAGARIGLLGGSFNPAHRAHRRISEVALARLGLDRVWWLVSPGNPLKDHADLAGLDARSSAARKLAATPRIVVTSFEAQLPTPFTAATIGFLRARHPGVCFVWLMGADALANFHRWRAWRSIFGQVPVAVIDRPGWHLKALAAPAARAFASSRIPEAGARLLTTMRPPAWTFLTTPLDPMSSTALRTAQSRPH